MTYSVMQFNTSINFKGNICFSSLLRDEKALMPKQVEG